MVQNAINRLKSGKSCGNDGPSAKHFKHANICINILVVFNTSVITDGHPPDDFIKIIIPLIKNKSGETSDVNNYRPTALVTFASNIFEIVLLELMESIWIREGSFH